ILLTACATKDPRVRALAMVTVFRVARINSPLALEVIAQIARRGVWFGVPRLRWLEMFTGCALGLYYEEPRNVERGRELRTLARDIVGRLWWLKLVVWVVPKGIDALWSSVPDDYTVVNPFELKAYKK